MILAAFSGWWPCWWQLLFAWLIVSLLCACQLDDGEVEPRKIGGTFIAFGVVTLPFAACFAWASYCTGQLF